MNNLIWITPLGFLALLGILCLILIYLLKPNFQQRIISSSYVWIKSLRYRKRQLPTSRFRNILLIICQVLILCICAFVLAQPFLEAGAEQVYAEHIIVIDASANMRAQSYGETRFQRAVDQAKNLAKETTDQENGKISVILAGYPNSSSQPGRGDTRILVRRETNLSTIYEALDNLLEGETDCTYSNGDVDGAIVLAEGILRETVDAKIVFFTATTYVDDGGVDIRYLKEEEDSNAAILNVEAIQHEGYYSFIVEFVSYAPHAVNIDLSFVINGVNEQKYMNISADLLPIRCNPGEIYTEEISTFSFSDGDVEIEDLRIESYEDVQVDINNVDMFDADNHFSLFGGNKKTIKVQYHSTNRNVFFRDSISALTKLLRNDWTIEFVEKQNKDAEVTSGFDFYIFEHFTPAKLPTDGIVFLANPNGIPSDWDIGLTMSDTSEKLSSNPNNYKFVFDPVETHPITSFVDVAGINTTKYRQFSSYSSDYAVLMRFLDPDGVSNPMFMVKNTAEQKIIAMPFHINFANFAYNKQFPFLMINIFKYFLPATLSDNIFEIGDTAIINSRNTSLTIDLPGGGTDSFTGNPNVANLAYSLKKPGIYHVTQPLIKEGDQQIDSFFVRIPTTQSDFDRVIDQIKRPFIPTEDGSVDLDLLIYFAASLVALLFIEWFLQTREQF